MESADDPLARIRQRQAEIDALQARHARELVAQRRLYWQAIADAAEELGATELSRRLGVSRERVYQLARKARTEEA